MTGSRIGIIGGNGWLGGAIARALVSGGVLEAGKLTLSGRSSNPQAGGVDGAHWTRNNAELVDRSDVVVLSVRPGQFNDVQLNASGKLVVSVMAAVPARTIAEQTGADRIVRSMPNAAAAIGRSFTPWHASGRVTPEDKSLVQTLFEACGEAAEVPMESHIDYCAGLTGSGAAFPALLAEALAADAIAQGLSADFARRAAKATVAGASQLFAGASGDTAVIVREMIDYRGTTAAALEAMLAGGFNHAVSAGLAAAVAKARTMA